MTAAQHTPGPWCWQINLSHRSLVLVGGQRRFDLIILDPVRWGMSSATLAIRDTAHDGMNIMHRLHERPDWVAPLPGRAHHADWCAGVVHPDMVLIEAAPDLLAAADAALECIGEMSPTQARVEVAQMLTAAIEKARGGVA